MIKNGALFCSAILAIILSLSIFAFLNKSNVLFSSIRPFPNHTLRDFAISSSLLPSLPIPKSEKILNSLDNFIKLSIAIEGAEKKVQGKAFGAYLRETKSKDKFVYCIEICKDCDKDEFATVEMAIDPRSGEIMEIKTDSF